MEERKVVDHHICASRFGKSCIHVGKLACRAVPCQAQTHRHRWRGRGHLWILPTLEMTASTKTWDIDAIESFEELYTPEDIYHGRTIVSIYALFLDGWDELSTWGDDGDNLYAQMTRNGNSDDDGPGFWITPPEYPTVTQPEELAHLVSQVTNAQVDTVLNAMAEGVPESRRHAMGLPSSIE